MSSSVSPLSSLASSSSLGTYFNGMSSYSSSLNQQISREVQLASLPIQILENDESTLDGESNELQTLNSDMQSVQSAISGLGSALSSMLTATVSGSSAVTATVSSGASAGVFTLTGINPGSYTEAISNAGSPAVTDPTSQNIGSSSTFWLTVGSSGTPIQITASNLNALAADINTSGTGIQATVVNVGGDTPDYRLSLQSAQLGDVSMQLNNDNGSDNLLQVTGGSPASYTVDNQQPPATRSSDTVTLAPGVTVNLTGTTSGSTTTTVTVSPNPTTVGNALASFVNAYNSAISDLNKNVGQGGGALAGQSVIYSMLSALQGLANYAGGSGAISSMAALGVTFNDTTGTLSFSQSTFNAATSNNSAALQAFLGSATGGGFLESATNTMNGLVDPTTGILTQDINTIQTSITNTNNQINDQENQVTQLQQNLTQEMSSTDAMIYSLQQQSSFFQQMFAAEQASETAGLG